MRWQIVPVLVVRTTGFPADLLDALRFPRAVDAVSSILALDRVIGQLREDILAPAFRSAVAEARGSDDQAALKNISAAREKVARGRPVDAVPDLRVPRPLAAVLSSWNAALEEREQMQERGRAVFEAELAERRWRLRDTIDRADVKEALFLSNPNARAAADRYLVNGPGARTGHVRKLERRLVTYLQRLCAKNETQSFFGPVNYGRIDPAIGPSLVLRRSARQLRDRQAFPAQWVAEAIAELIGADPGVRSYLTPRRDPCCLLEGDALRYPRDGRRRALDRTDARLVALADGRRTVAALAAAVGGGTADTWSRLVRLRSIRAIVMGPVVPPDQADPLEVLARWLGALPVELEAAVRWRGIIDELRSAIVAFADAPASARPALLGAIEAMFTRVTGQPATRRAGRTYADRAVLFEECLGDLETFLIGGDLARAIDSSLQPILTLAADYGELELLSERRTATAFLHSVAPGGSVPFPGYLSALARQPPGVPSACDELTAFLAELDRVVRLRDEGDAVRLAADDLPSSPAVPSAERCLVTSVDLMIAASSLAELQAGRFRLVIGEVHPLALPWVFPTGHFLSPDDRAALAEGIYDGIKRQPGGALAAQLAHTRTNKVFPYPLPGPVIEMRARFADTAAIPAASVEVALRNGHACLRAPGTGWLRLYPPLRRRTDRLDPVSPFAFAAAVPPRIGTGDHTPRVEIDSTILQREHWSLATGPFGGRTGHEGFSLFLESWRRKARLGIPDQVYVRIPEERKPIFVDFRNYFLVELLDHLARLGTRLEISEALPSTDELWLAGPGGRYCCEIRLLALGDADGDGSGEDDVPQPAA